MIQYEAMTGFLILLILSILTSGLSCRLPMFRYVGGMAMGFLLAFISIIQVRYTGLLLIPLAYPALVGGTKLQDRGLRQSATALLTLSFCLQHGRSRNLLSRVEPYF